jgi:hypothetical protein
MPRIFGGFDITLRMTLELVFIRNNVGISTKTIFWEVVTLRTTLELVFIRNNVGISTKTIFFEVDVTLRTTLELDKRNGEVPSERCC